MISFRVDSEATAQSILNKTELVLYAESLGGVETLITYPVTQTHAEVPESQRLARGIDGKLFLEHNPLYCYTPLYTSAYKHTLAHFG